MTRDREAEIERAESLLGLFAESSDLSPVKRQAVKKIADEFSALRAALRSRDEEIARLREALIWCSGSEDFGKGGKAEEGWRKVCAPLLNRKDTP